MGHVLLMRFGVSRSMRAAGRHCSISCPWEEMEVRQQLIRTRTTA